MHSTVSPLVPKQPRLSEPPLMPVTPSSSCRPSTGALGEPAMTSVGDFPGLHHKASPSDSSPSASPGLLRRDVLTAVHNRLERTAHCIYPGSLVVYEFLNEEQEWHWALGTIQKVHRHTVELLAWSCQQGGASASVLLALRKEEARVQRELEDHQAAIFALRAELGAARARNEADINATRDAIEARRRALEANHSVLQVCRKRGVPLRPTPSEVYDVTSEKQSDDDVYASVLRAALCIVEDHVPATPRPWPELWAAVSNPLFLQRCIDYDVGHEMSVELRDEVDARFFASGAITEAKVHRAMASMEKKMPEANELLCVASNWLFTQLAAFQVYQQCASTQSHADALQQRLAYHVNALKEAARRQRQVQTRLRVFSGAPGSSSGTGGVEAMCIFVPADEVATEVLCCAIVCPVPEHSRRRRGLPAAPMETTATSAEQQSPSSSSHHAATSSIFASLQNTSQHTDKLDDHHGDVRGADPVHSTVPLQNPLDQSQLPPHPLSASTIPTLSEATEAVVLGHEELDEIAERAMHARPDLYQAIVDLLPACEGDLRYTQDKDDSFPTKTSRYQRRRVATRPQDEGVEVPLSTDVLSSSLHFATLPTSHGPPFSAEGQRMGTTPFLPVSESSARVRGQVAREGDDKVDTHSLLGALAGLQQKLEDAHHKNNKLQKLLTQEAVQHEAVEAELQRQLQVALEDHEDVRNRLSDATIRAEALQIEFDDLDRSMSDATKHITALEGEIRALRHRLDRGVSADPVLSTATTDNGGQTHSGVDDSSPPSAAELTRLLSSTERWIPQHSGTSDLSEDLVITHHHKCLPGHGWDQLLQRHPAELRRAAAVDAAAACRVVTAAITGVHFTSDGNRVSFSVAHPRNVTKGQLDGLIPLTRFYECEYMLLNSSCPKTGEDDLAQRLAESQVIIADLERRLAEVSSMTSLMSLPAAKEIHAKQAPVVQELLTATAEVASATVAHGESRVHTRYGTTTLTTHTVRIPGKDWGIILQQGTTGLVQALTTDIDHGTNGHCLAVQNVYYSCETLLAQVQVLHDSDIPGSDIEQRIQTFGYPSTMAFYRQCHQQHSLSQTSASLLTETPTPRTSKSIDSHPPEHTTVLSSETSPPHARQHAADDNLSGRHVVGVTGSYTNNEELQLADREAEVADLREQLQDAEGRAESAQAQLADREAEVADLQEELYGVWTVAKQSRQQVEVLQVRIEALESENADLMYQLEIGAQFSEKVEEQLGDREAEMAELKTHRFDVEGRVEGDLPHSMKGVGVVGSSKYQRLSCADVDSTVETTGLPRGEGTVLSSGEGRDVHDDSAESTATLGEKGHVRRYLAIPRALTHADISGDRSVVSSERNLSGALSKSPYFMEEELPATAPGEVSSELVRRLEGELEAVRGERDYYARRFTESEEAADSLVDELERLHRELETKATDNTDTLEKLEEFVKLVEAARAAEMAAVHSRDMCEQELHALQARYDNDLVESQRSLLLPGEARCGEDASSGVKGPGCGVGYSAPGDSGRGVAILSEADRENDGGCSPCVSRASGCPASVGLREQLEQLKREKEALLDELDVRDVRYNDALTLLNEHIRQLMDELSGHLRGGETSAINARALLHEIAELRAAQGRIGTLVEGTNIYGGSRQSS